MCCFDPTTPSLATPSHDQRQGQKTIAKARRHPWSIISIITTIPILLAMSLFSTVFCPPPGSDVSPVSRFVLSPLGLHDHSGRHSQLHQTLCYPSNVYHRNVLQPYIYPFIEDRLDRIRAGPVYVKAIKPAYTSAVETTRQAWNGPVKPVVERIQRGARKFYLTFVEPHIPYLKTKYTALTAPYTSRVTAFHNQHLAPHLATANRYAHSTSKRSVELYKQVAAHPYTGHAARYANQIYQLAKVKGHQAYQISKPHAIRAGKEAERVVREILGPRVLEGLKWSKGQLDKVGAIVKL